MQKSSRLKRELTELIKGSKEGISCCSKNDNMDTLLATIIGPNNSPYNGGTFQVEIKIPDRYPFEPPGLKFLTPIYHPNIDTNGRICMNLLKMPPKGGWKPTISLQNLLSAVQLLLLNPNPDDPLMVEIAEEYYSNKSLFDKKARKYTEVAMLKVNEANN
ncbi:ubiquitin-conjugating enzyme E2 T-like [Prorops nasuta]|uniref:ubiquitin-conjugating enzyme E2 T-like n=1 Tax=Prorops nasuta TaxID=863751 RepID=UPI0034CDF206